MNNGGDAAEQVVRLSLEGFEVAARLSGSAAKNIALLLVSVLKQEQKTKGKANRIVGVHFGCCSVCGTWLCEVQRYDRRESNLCVDKIGVFNAEEAGISLHQCLLRTDEAKH